VALDIFISIVINCPDCRAVEKAASLFREKPREIALMLWNSKIFNVSQLPGSPMNMQRLAFCRVNPARSAFVISRGSYKFYVGRNEFLVRRADAQRTEAGYDRHGYTCPISELYNTLSSPILLSLAHPESLIPFHTELSRLRSLRFSAFVQGPKTTPK
jgi:hypothetical protein